MIGTSHVEAGEHKKAHLVLEAPGLCLVRVTVRLTDWSYLAWRI